jgi:hypothetical protein
MPGKVECDICEEERDATEVDDQGVCNDCHEENAEETREELRAAGIDPEDSPVVIAAEIARRIFG